jgi:NADPH-dependent glutamate synthase beta subunit-like oxidoreductase
MFDSMKLDKTVVQRRLDLMAAEGIVSTFLVARPTYRLMYDRNSYPMRTLVSTSTRVNSNATMTLL